MNNEIDLDALRSRIKMLQIAYFVLFGLSLIMIVMQRSSPTGPDTTIVWACCLGGAVITRLYRTSLVNKYNAALGNRMV